MVMQSRPKSERAVWTLRVGNPRSPRYLVTMKTDLKLNMRFGSCGSDTQVCQGILVTMKIVVNKSKRLETYESGTQDRKGALTTRRNTFERTYAGLRLRVSSTRSPGCPSNTRSPTPIQACSCGFGACGSLKKKTGPIQQSQNAQNSLLGKKP